MIIYLTMDGLHSSPFVTQVLGYVAPLWETGADLRLVVWTRTTPARRALCDERAAMTRRLLNNSALLLERGANLSFLNRKTLVKDVQRALKQWRIPVGERILFHARSPWAGMVGLELQKHWPNSKVITDFRGTLAAEANLVLKGKSRCLQLMGRLWIREAAKVEAACARHSDHLFCVSRAFKELLVERYGLDASRITVIPCFVDTERFSFDPAVRDQVRKEWRIDPDTLVLVYSGTMRYYSKNEEILRLFRRIRATGRKTFLALITPDRAMAEEQVRNSCIPPEAVRITTGDHDQVARWVQAGDVALLLRDQDEVNRVACPIKFAEYVRSGVKTLVTPGLGDISEFVQTRGAGWVYDSSGEIPEGLLDRYGQEERLKLSRTSADVFGREKYIPRILERYETLVI